MNTPNGGSRRTVGALVSLAVPGSGHFLLGAFRRGVLWVVLLSVAAVSVPFIHVFGLLAGLLLRVGSAVDVYRTDVARPRWKPVIAGWLTLIAWNLAFGAVVRTYVTHAYTIPSGTMMDTLMVGDYVVTDNMTYLFRKPNRADVVVFRYPLDEQRSFVKRVIATPGDVIQVRGSQVFVNKEPVEERYVRQGYASQGGTVFCGYAYACEPTTVPPDSYFVMGDNRDNSQDSRYWGFVKRQKIEGKVILVYWSWDVDRRQVRWSRIGHSVQ